MNEWISVWDRLPGKQIDVMIFAHPKGYAGYHDLGFIGTDLASWWDDMGEKMIADVTHWMPLPEPPNGN
jgi:hypothetical protein